MKAKLAVISNFIFEIGTVILARYKEIKCKISPLGFAGTVLARFTSCETLMNLAEKLSRSGKMTETLQLRGTLRGHNGWVTQITTNPKYPDMILSSSRDKSLIVWKLTR